MSSDGSCYCCGQRDAMTSGGCLRCGNQTLCGCGVVILCSCGRSVKHQCKTQGVAILSTQPT
jgi:hypothetical protein